MAVLGPADITPRQSGWSPLIAPLPSGVVITGELRLSANLVSSPVAFPVITPPPTQIKGCLASASNLAAGTYLYTDRLLTIEDPLAVAPALSAPKDKSVTATSVALSWKALESPVTIYYQYDVATDAKFANKVAAACGSTSGTAVTVTGLTAGTQYWWRVYADDAAGSPLTSKKSAYWTFTPKLVAPTVFLLRPGQLESCSCTNGGGCDVTF